MRGLSQTPLQPSPVSGPSAAPGRGRDGQCKVVQEDKDQRDRPPATPCPATRPQLTTEEAGKWGRGQAAFSTSLQNEPPLRRVTFLPFAKLPVSDSLSWDSSTTAYHKSQSNKVDIVTANLYTRNRTRRPRVLQRTDLNPGGLAQSLPSATHSGPSSTPCTKPPLREKNPDTHSH